MKFVPGQVVIHPHHGPATVAQVTTRTIRDRRVRFLTLNVHDPELSVFVPTERAEEIGVRPVVDIDGARDLFKLLLAPGEEKEKVWSRRIKNSTERLRSGDIRTIAGLIRDLTRWNADKRLSFGEMKLLRDACDPFVSELAIALSTTEDEVAAMVDAAALEGTWPSIPESVLAAAS
ncbi:CarD family transcriptional regulator [Georgenia yuyongxinii]|uniref:CarD family transcriptional regulator n=1 Tax=Georgenia yuyongxinii TaxID=2589797 RepID=A0A5B8BZ20_9MICO|nr:CarD family transcriptional regulator [Georgenia yuyongxinii]QDC23518.1 CarD family transcriptional regulator [Georgenia yuyongxinii]